MKYHHCELGLNSRLDELQASIVRIKFRHLEAWNNARRRHAYRYNQLFANVAGIVTPKEIGNAVRCVYHQYTIRVENREAVSKQLTAAGIGNMVYYPVPLHQQEVHQDLGYKLGSFPESEAAARQCLSLPMFPELTEAQQDEVVKAVIAAVGGGRSELRKSA